MPRTWDIEFMSHGEYMSMYLSRKWVVFCVTFGVCMCSLVGLLIAVLLWVCVQVSVR